MNVPNAPAPLRGARFPIAVLVLLLAVLAMPLGAAAPLGGSTPGAIAAPHAGTAVAPALPPAILPAGVHVPASVSSQVSARIALSSQYNLNSHQMIPWYGPGSAQFAAAKAARTGGPSVPTPPAPTGGVGPGSTADNFYITDSDCSGWYDGWTFVPWVSGSGIASLGPSNQSLVAAGGSFYNLFNYSGLSPCLTPAYFSNYTLLYGLSQVYTTSDGGQQWTMHTVAPNATLWKNDNASLTNSSIGTGQEYVAGDAAGNAAVIMGYAPACVVISVKCGGLHGQYGPWGFAISSTHNGGSTWSNASQIPGVNGLSYLTPSATCAGLGVTAQVIVNNIPENPWIIVSGNTEIATWTVLQQNFNQATCSINVNAVVQVTHSTDGGVTWSAPVNATNVVTDGGSIAFGSSSSTVYLVAEDSGNYSSASNSLYFSFQKSSNSGATWTTESDIMTAAVHPVAAAAASPDQWGTAQRPVLAVDNWSTSTHNGNLYLVWEDNGTGSQTGYAAVMFTMSTDGGTTWSTPVQITPAGSSFVYLEPTLTVGPTGVVWVTYYGVNESGAGNGGYNVYGDASLDGGTTWIPQFRVSDTTSFPGTTPNPPSGTALGNSVGDLGFYMGAVATSAGDVPVWADCRNFDCGSDFDVQLYSAVVGLANLTTNAPPASGATASVNTFGTVSTYSLPATIGWTWGSSHTVSAPATLPYNATAVEAFTGYGGLSASTSSVASVTYNSLTTPLVVNYQPEPATFLEGSITPYVPGTVLKLDQVTQILTNNGVTSSFTIIVPQNGQAHWLNVTAPNYQPSDKLVATNSNGITWVNFSLSRLTGSIKITLAASQGFSQYQSLINNASVNVNGTAVTFSNGVASVNEPFGTYNVAASLAGFVYQQSPSNPVAVTAGTVKQVTLTFSGGWINGTVVPAVSGTVLKINGTAVSLNSAGGFGYGVPGGFHTLTATAPGYNLSVINNIGVVPLAAHFVNVSLTNHGYISGSILPTGAFTTAFVRLTPASGSAVIAKVSATAGTYNESVTSGTWTVTTTATGYQTNTTSVAVSAGNTSSVAVTLTLSGTTGCQATNTCPPPNCTVTNNCTVAPASGGFPLLDIALIVIVVIVVVAVLVAVLMMRGRSGGGGGGGDQYAPSNQTEQQVYGNTPTADIQKLQPDGSMGGPPPGAQ